MPPTFARTQLAILSTGKTITANEDDGPLVWVLKNGAWLFQPTGAIANAGPMLVISDNTDDQGPVDKIHKDASMPLRDDDDPWPIPPPPPPPSSATTFAQVGAYLQSQYPNGLWPRSGSVSGRGK